MNLSLKTAVHLDWKFQDIILKIFRSVGRPFREAHQTLAPQALVDLLREVRGKGRE
jgi:hypothetical protein